MPLPRIYSQMLGRHRWPCAFRASLSVYLRRRPNCRPTTGSCGNRATKWRCGCRCGPEGYPRCSRPPAWRRGGLTFKGSPELQDFFSYETAWDAVQNRIPDRRRQISGRKSGLALKKTIVDVVLLAYESDPAWAPRGRPRAEVSRELHRHFLRNRCAMFGDWVFRLLVRDGGRS